MEKKCHTGGRKFVWTSDFLPPERSVENQVPGGRSLTRLGEGRREEREEKGDAAR